jgi:hypothetical protein
MYKLLHKNLEHRGFKYKEGLNVDHVPFTAYGDCEPGGLYYTDFAHIGMWFNVDYVWIADVTVPADAHVHPGPRGDKWKADRIVLSNIRPLGPFLAQQTDDVLYQWLLNSADQVNFFKAITPQPPSLALKVVSESGCWLAHIDNPTLEMCVAAITEGGWHVLAEHTRPEWKTPELIAWIRQEHPEWAH